MSGGASEPNPMITFKAGRVLRTAGRLLMR